MQLERLSGVPVKPQRTLLRIGELIVPREHQGDVVVNNWIAAMMSIYKRLTGKKPENVGWCAWDGLVEAKPLAPSFASWRQRVSR